MKSEIAEKLSQAKVDEVIFQILSIVRRKANEGDVSAKATIYEALEKLEMKEAKLYASSG